MDRYERRRPEQTPLHRFIGRHLESWLAARSLGERPVPTHVEGELREYLRCGILCFGFARARCTRCGHGFLVAFLHRFGSALNCHVHLHACVTDGLFMPDHAGVAFLPARPVTPADLATLTERVRRRFLRTRLLDAEAAADMLAWENSGFSVDASVRVALVDRDVPSYCRTTRSGPPSRRWRSPTLPLSLSLREGPG